LNDEELSVLTGMFSLQGDVRRQMEWLGYTFGLETVVLTCGPRGSLIYQEGCWSEQAPQPISVVDTVGAGDAFTATLTMGLLNRWNLSEIHALAAKAAQYVCSRPGATPALPASFRGKFVSRSSVT